MRDAVAIPQGAGAFYPSCGKMWIKYLCFMLVLYLLPVKVMAGRGEIGFVETAVDLRTDGQAVVAYTVQWRVLEGDLHGFYFSGNARLRV